MEVVGAAVAVIQLAQLSAEILSKGYGFLPKVTNAPTEIRRLLIEAAAVNVLLGQLEALPESPSTATALQSLTNTGIFAECRNTLQSVDQTLLEYEKHPNGIERVGQRLAWPKKEKQIKDDINMLRLSKLRDIISSVIQANTAKVLDQIETKQLDIQGGLSSLSQDFHSHISDVDAEKAISWLCPESDTPQHTRLQALSEVCQSGTGQSLISSEAFRTWLADDKTSILWITNLPGAGKSVLSATFINHLRSLSYPQSTVLFFFAGYGFQSNPSPKAFLMTLASQLARSSPSCLRRVREVQKTRKNDRQFLTDAEYLSLIKSSLGAFNRAFIVVDGLDESPALDRKVISNYLKDISHQSEKPGNDKQSGGLCKVLLTSRANHEMDKTFRGIAIQLSLIGSLEDDLKLWVTTQVEESPTVRLLRGTYGDLVEKLKSELITSSGTFLQVKLHLSLVDTARSARDLRTVINSLSDGYEATYEKILVSIQEQYPHQLDEIKLILEWLVVDGPMATSQLAEAVSIRPNDTNLDFEGIPADVDDVIAPLAQIVSTQRTTDGELSVQLLHQTVKDYLTSGKLLDTPAKFFHVDKPNAHAKVADLCLQYLSFSDFEKASIRGFGKPLATVLRLRWLPGTGLPEFGGGEVIDEPEAIFSDATTIASTQLEVSCPTDCGCDLETTRHGGVIKGYALIKYATSHWFEHLRISEQEKSHLKISAQRLEWFVQEENPRRRESWRQVLRQYNPTSFAYKTPICFAIYAQLESVVDILLPRLLDVDKQLDDGMTCLTVAARHNNIRVARKLLELGADVNKATTGRELTPLHAAAESADEEMVDLLLSYNANIHARSTSHTTPFYRAARGGSTYILRLLYTLGNDMNGKSYDGWTPLMEAVEQEHYQAVMLLLELGADPWAESEDTQMAYKTSAWALAREICSWPSAEKETRVSEGGKILSALVEALDSTRKREDESMLDSGGDTMEVDG